MAVFDKGTQDLFFTTMNVPYGHIYVERADQPLLVTNRQGARGALLSLHYQLGLISLVDAGVILYAMQKAGVAKDGTRLRRKVLRYLPPAGFRPFLTFHMCGDHGHLVDNYATIHASISCFKDGLDICHKFALKYGQKDTLKCVDAIVALQQVAASPLPFISRRASKNFDLDEINRDIGRYWTERKAHTTM